MRMGADERGGKGKKGEHGYKKEGDKGRIWA